MNDSAAADSPAFPQLSLARGAVESVRLSVRTPAEAQVATEFLAELCPDPSRQALGISELLLNAIEHGNLEIDAQAKAQLLREDAFLQELDRRLRLPEYATRRVTVELRKLPDYVELTVEDAGNGFDYAAWSAESTACGPCGRGIALARTLSFDMLEYEGRGNRVVARVEHTSRAQGYCWAELSPWERRLLEVDTRRALHESGQGQDLELLVRRVLQQFGARTATAYFLSDSDELQLVALVEAQSSEQTTKRRTVIERAQLPCLWQKALHERQVEKCNAVRFHPFLGVRHGRSLLAPLTFRDRAFGMLQLGDKETDFDARDALKLALISEQLAPYLAAHSALQSAALKRAQLEEERALKREEEELARHLLGGILREGCLDAAGIRHKVTAKDLFNGDIALAARLPDGGLRWMLGDFVGHGLPAAIGGLPLAAVFYATCKKGISLSEVVATMNESMLGALPKGFFCAAILLELSRDRSVLRVWNGGMPACLVRSARDGEIRQIPSRDLPLGAVPGVNLALAIEVLPVASGDRVWCFSDGLPETHCTTGELYGIERAVQLLSSTPPDAGFDALLRSVEEFRGHDPFSDDVSLIEVNVAAV